MSWSKTPCTNRRPVVRIEVLPKLKVDVGSVIAGGLLTLSSGCIMPAFHEYDFSGDLYDFKLYKNDTLITDLNRAVILEKISIIFPEIGTVNTVQDIAQFGIFEYSINTFRPNKGKFPKIKLILYDLKAGLDNPEVILVEEKIIAKIWEDFLPYTSDSLNIDLIESILRPKSRIPVTKTKYDYLGCCCLF